MISEFIKKIEVKTIPLLIALLVVLVIARLWYNQSHMLLELSIILLFIYLFILFINWIVITIDKKKQVAEHKQSEVKKKSIRNEQTYELIWTFFLGLSNRQMQILSELITLPKVGSKYKMVVQPSTKLKNQLACDDSFKIRINLNQYLPLLIISYNYEPDAPMVVDIDQTLYNLAEHYMKTGKKEHI